jgi:hypothetical protein
VAAQTESGVLDVSDVSGVAHHNRHVGIARRGSAWYGFPPIPGNP